MKRRIILWICLLGWCLDSFGQEAFIDLQFRPVLPGGNISSSFDDWVSGRQSVSYVLCVSDTGDYYIHFDAYHNDHFLIGARFLQRVNNPGCTLYGQSNFNFGDYLDGNVDNVGDPTYFNAVTQFAIRTRMLPAGEFRLCFKVYDRSGFGLLSEDCAEGRMTGFQPPTLISPLGSIHASTQPVLFQWTHVSPSLGFTPSVSLNVYEVYPGQTPVQAVEGNIPLITRSISNFNQYYWMPMEMPFYPGDTAHLAWQLQADAPMGIDQADPYGRSEVGEVWVYFPGVSIVVQPSDPVTAVDSPPSPCTVKVDAGPDKVYYLGQADPVQIGTPDDPKAIYEWASDPPGIVAFGSTVNVRPSVTTHYVVYKKDSAVGCEAWDDVWVRVERPIAVEIHQDPCGNLVAVAKPDLIWRDTTHKSRCIREADGVVLRCDEVTYRFKGAMVATPGIVLESPCDRKLPPGFGNVAEPMAADTIHYAWSNGTFGPKLVAAEPGTYTVTATNGVHSTVSSIVCRPSIVALTSFPVLSVTPILERDGSNPYFEIREIVGGGSPSLVGRSLKYELVLQGSGNFRLVKAGITTTGFRNGELKWDGRVRDGGRLLPLGSTVYWHLEITDACDPSSGQNPGEYVFRDILQVNGERREYSREWIGNKGTVEIH